MRSIDHLIRSSIRAQVVNNFNLDNVVGLGTLPAFTQRLTSRTPEPYLLFKSEGSDRVDDTKTNSPRAYSTVIRVRDSYATGTGGPHIVDQLVDEVLRIVDGNLPVISGFNAYIQTVESIFRDSIENENKSFFWAEIEVVTRIVDVIVVGDAPIQLPGFLFTGFTYPPTNNRIELGDTGVVTPQTVYSSPNNGFTFVDAMFELAVSSDSAIAQNGTINVDGDDVVAINSTLNYVSTEDSDNTPSLTATTTLNRIRSLRTGLITGSTPDLTSISSDIMYGVVAPSGQEVTFQGTPGNRAYIAYDANEPALNSIFQTGINHNIINEFTMTVSNGYRVYVLNHPFLYNNVLTVNLN